MPNTPPSVGRIVHYVTFGTSSGTDAKQCRAGIITEVPADLETTGGAIGLAVFNPTGTLFTPATADHSDLPSGGTWHWPEVI